MKQIILLLLMALMIISCQKKLSREEAKSQIANHDKTIYLGKQNYKIAKNFIKNVNTKGNGVTVVLGKSQFKKKRTDIEEFERLGLLKLTEKPHREVTTQFLLGTTVRTWTSVKVTLTKTGRKYMVRDLKNKYEVNLWETNIKEITGIREMPNKETEVQYTIYNTKITPFGKIFSNKKQVGSKSAYFSRYDDGWRINK